MCDMRLKLGNSSAVVAPAFSLRGNEEAVVRMLVNGYTACILANCARCTCEQSGERTYIKTWSAFANHTFQSFDKLACLALLLLYIADPILLSCTEYNLFGVRGHGVK